MMMLSVDSGHSGDSEFYTHGSHHSYSSHSNFPKYRKYKKYFKWTAISVVVALLLILVISVIGAYNEIVEEEEEVNRNYSAISVQLQRRADLIPNFVNTVKGYSDYEKETYTAVTEARASLGSAKSVTEQAEASDKLDKAINVWVNAVTENYPELKANEQYRALQDELSGTENRIGLARKDYNDSVSDYNSEIRKFPRNLFAKILGFEKKEYFDVPGSYGDVPSIEF